MPIKFLKRKAPFVVWLLQKQTKGAPNYEDNKSFSA